MKTKILISILALIMVPALVSGNEAQLKSTKKMDAGDPQLNKMNRYLSIAKNAKKQGLGVIRDIRVLIFKLNHDVEKCTITKAELEAIKRGEGIQEEGYYSISQNNVNLSGNTPCSPDPPRREGEIRGDCKHIVNIARTTSAQAAQYLKCIKRKYTYLERIEKEIKRICSKRKLIVKENKDIKKAMDSALAKAIGAQEKFDPMITQLKKNIRNYKTCVALKKSRTIRGKR